MPNTHMSLPRLDDAKAQAKRLRTQLQADGTAISHSKSLELIASQFGYRDWNTFHAAAGNQSESEFALGEKVSGKYLGHVFTGTVISLETINGQGWKRIGIDFDTPMDVVTFDSFSSFRKRIHGTIGPDGHTKEKTSDGQPHLQLNI
ncbi:conserved hypothetical protein [Roseibium sp. TrichSKD4]|uniref:glyoxalase superfamily protein n=1 Tax=Roseibium sp. TrichSKD4 TaxID=744980 RepID=UPI0001E575C3|nr:glyoxalase superfamily protein [Roseibium sp. TrichSKD4]EFO29406.1 conserved hypothetical protein [Roseibium sp. TrichSKD4]